MIKSTNNKGFQLTFTNGYTISVQFGMGNYCNNRNRKDTPADIYSCKDAEVAWWWSDGVSVPRAVELGGVQIKSYCDANEVAELINIVSNL